MIIRYIPESGEAYTSGNITLLSAARINQSPRILSGKSGV